MQASGSTSLLPSSESTTLPSQPVQPDTNVTPRQTSDLPYRNSDLEASRLAVIRDLGRVIILPFSDFENLLPPVPISKADLTGVKDANIIDDRWKQWENDPSKTEGHEDDVFKAFVELFDSIIDFCEKTPTARLVNNPTLSPASERSNTSKPDGYLLRQPAEFSGQKEDSVKDSWQAIAVPLEYKKHDKKHDQSDNKHKIIWSMHHIIRSDPCRRFTFGITIEDTRMRVWQCHHAATVVSETFNFIQDHDNLLTVLMSLAFAKAEELGWDPTLRRRQDGALTQYDIDIEDDKGNVHTFTADSIISDFGAEAMQGRGTRVFRAKYKEGNGSTVVVKEVWQDQDRQREGDLLHDIMDKIQEKTDEKMKETNKRLFLSVICHGDVRINGETDGTLNLIMRGIPVPQNLKYLDIPLPGHVPQRKLRTGSVGNVPHIGVETHTFLGAKRSGHIYHRVHYRIAFAEEGQSLYVVHNLRDIFQALVDAAHALKLMFEQNLLHRDVSAGNILLIGGHGRISDLEYAKKVTDYSQHDVRTGTAYFMAVEVASEKYKFGRMPRPVFKQNAIHDLESLWWVAVWALFTQIPDGTLDFEKQRKSRNELFTNTGARLSIVIEPNNFEEHTANLPELFRKAAIALQKAIEELSTRYRMAEKWAIHDGKPSINEDAFSGIHDTFIEFLTEAQESSPKNDVIVLPELNEKAVTDEPKRKRARHA